MGKRVLLAEDDGMSRDSMERILSIHGYEVTTAEDGRDALEIIVSNKNPSQSFDYLIFNERMPNLTGLKLIAEIIRQNINIPTFLITGFGGK